MTEPKRIRPRRISESFVVQIQVENGIAQNYLTATQVTKKHSIGRAWVKRLAQHGRIPGAFKMGNTWCIPGDWVPPALPRGRPKTTAARKSDRA